MRRKIRRIHFVGVGGAGMCGLAEVVRGLGYEVSGSDAREQASLARLRAAGVRVFVGHDAAHVGGADCVVYSGAVPPGNAERAAASARGIPAVPRAQMLGEVLRFKTGIAVAGTHGKTTVSSMLSSILTAASFDPTCIIGGRFLDGGGHARIGGGEYVIAEADESDASFLHLHPEAAVVTNIDNDHLSAFGGDIEKLRGAFLDFLGNLPFYGAAALCADDAAAARLADGISSPRAVLYGMREDAEVRAAEVSRDGAGMRFLLRISGGEFAGDYPVRLRAAGLHNVLNAAGACAMARELGAGPEAMASGLENYRGVARRLESHGKISVAQGGAFLVDDYAHHPAEIAAAAEAARGAHPGRKLLLVFQPHRYTRTRDVFSELVSALCLGDGLVLLPVYPAGELPLPGADSDALAAALKKRGADAVRVDDLPSAADAVRRTASDGGVVMTMGAGDVGGLPAMLKEAA